MEGKSRKRLIILCAIVGLVLIAGIIWYRWPYKEYKGLGMRPTMDVSDNIVLGTENKLFAKALGALGYTTFLHGKGPYTVFVPTDAAFTNLPRNTKDFLANGRHVPYVRQVLLYHVVKGQYRYRDLRDGMRLKTVEGEELQITKKNGFFVINGYSYIQTYDVISSNGVIHLVNNYLLPPSVLAL